MDCFGSWFSKELIKQLDIRERASRHHSVVASAGPVGVELTRSKASVCQVLGRGAAPGDAPRGRYVVCGDRVPQIQEDMRIFNGLQGNWLFGKLIKK